MKIKLYIILFFLTLNSITIYSQNGLKNAPNTTFVTDSNSFTFLISTRPVTNRDYLIYLQWLATVYIDYPNIFVEAFPGLDSSILNEFVLTNWTIDTSKLKYFNVIASDYRYLTYMFCIERSPSYVKNIMLNPKYIDYPIIGLTWLQASNYCKWLSDRYNEYTLISRKYIKELYSQINEDCFISETYLRGDLYDFNHKYYRGELYPTFLKGLKPLNWKDSLMIPAFRLPTKHELDFCAKKSICLDDFKPYPYKKGFMNKWHELFLDIKNEGVVLKEEFYGRIKDCLIIKLPINNYEFDSLYELTLDQDTAENHNKTILEIFADHGQYQVNLSFQDYKIRRDSLGKLPVIIIDEDKNKNPVLVENFKNDKRILTDTIRVGIFRFACTMKPKQYVP